MKNIMLKIVIILQFILKTSHCKFLFLSHFQILHTNEAYLKFLVHIIAILHNLVKISNIYYFFVIANGYYFYSTNSILE